VAADLIRGLLAAVAAGVLPGYFWAVMLRPASALAERLAYSAALSMAGVPVVAILLARASGGGVTLWIALLAVAIVLGTGVLAYRVRGAARGPAAPALPSPAVTADPRVLTLGPAPSWSCWPACSARIRRRGWWPSSRCW